LIDLFPHRSYQMFKKTQVGVAAATLVAGLVGSPTLVLAQVDQRVEITGSAIKRIDAELAVPVQVLRRSDIEQSGATSTVDLLQRLAVVQGSTSESASVGGGSFGFSGISIHNIGETRTLVLLNGRRLAQFGGQTLTGFAAAIDLNSIPISAIERVEILTDGASALYGADAIAGVVNFITKRDTTAGDVTLGYSKPKDGAEEKRVSVTKGFGSLATDGFNIIGTFAHDERTKLDAVSRPFAASGKVLFSANGQNYRFQQFSASPIPANATDDDGNLISPYLKVNGACPVRTFRVTEGADDYCGFDFVSTLEIYPVRKRDSAMLSGALQLGEQMLFADVLWSRTKQTSRIAPVPGGISIPAGTPLHDKYLLPLGITQDSTAFYRLFDLGKRENNDTADFYNVSVGAKGSFADWDYEAAVSKSRSEVKGSISGYPGALALRSLRASGLLDPFVLVGQQTPAAQSAIEGTSYKGYWDGGVSDLTTVDARGSREIFKLSSGSVMLAAGVTYAQEKFESKPSLFAQAKLADPVLGTLCDPSDPAKPCDQRFGDASAVVPYAADRRAYGVFGELSVPVTKTLEVSASLRHDNFSDFGNASTAKGSFRWKATPDILLRGSVGTGFHAPTVPQVRAAPQSFGVTSDNYTCTPELQAQATRLGAQCQPGNRQYDVVAGGNALLKPEKSRQATLGIRFEPSPAISVGVDLWHVAVRDVFGQLTEQTVFGDPGRFPGAWSTAVDVGTGITYLALNQANLNLGKSYSTGVDLDVSSKVITPIGELTTKFNGTYMIRERSQLEIDGPYYSAIANNAELGAVTFRFQGKLAAALKTGAWTHTLGLNYKSGYKDQETEVEVLDASGNATGLEALRLDVKQYTTVDWQTQWEMIKNVSLSLGVLNLFDKDPPFSLSTGGVNKGQQFGYDDRYYDPRGRTYYVNLAVKF
jgi:iron complex outermembrane recepter protein